MHTVRWYGRRDVRFEETDLGGPLAASEVEIEVAFCGVCGSDLAEYRDGPVVIQPGPHPLTKNLPPVTLGHEFAGVVTAVGAEVAAVTVGDRVSADACLRCQECSACQRGEYNLCPLSGAIGIAIDGAMADRVRVPSYCVVPLPEEVTLRAGALLEPYAVALHGLDRGGAEAGQTVVVSGFGPIGAATAELAAASGLRTLVVEPAAGRAARARELGHELVVGESAKERAAWVRNLSAGGVDLVVEASGVPEAVAAGFRFLRRGGAVVAVGVPKRPLELDGLRTVLMEQALLGSLGYQNDLPRVASMIAAGRIDPERIVTAEEPLAAAPEVLERLSDQPADDLKVLLRIGPRGPN